MKNSLFKVGFLSLLSLTLMSPLVTPAPRVHACSCVIPGTPVEEMEKSDAVFSGQVIEMESTPTGYVVSLEVFEFWKGDVPEEVTVQTGMGGGDCGFNFERGKNYMVYAHAAEEGYMVYSCGLTSLLADANTEPLGPSTLYTNENHATEEAKEVLHGWLLTGGAVLAVVLFGTLGVIYAPKKKK